ncbi:MULTISPECIES: glycosyl hydrolase family 8 [unclassified Crossiella]|uniref:glycosyl hydrolase family 8 n=1 Tax=unclassified Crossiella TaxID=2620835 RepID=UPI001FFE3A8F|nr:MULTISPECIES: glycosyl hydrolase family 8 [unclassified Crossiella]MCK2238039.1 glycosyl hydrolase family 8 [Crossiella sp. S99.2]MCK2255322.1 glycosyl hydrolase family 8 [Crossiella sp. S99.1]
MNGSPRLITGVVVTTLLAGLCVGAGTASAATNLALGANVSTSSAEDASLAGPAAVDGNTGTRWASAEGADPQWIQLDLRAAKDIRQIRLNWEAAYAKAYRLEASDDGNTWRALHSTSAGDGGLDEISVSTTARHLRLTGTQRGTAYGYSLWEFEVYGVGGQEPPPANGYLPGTLRPSVSQAEQDQVLSRYYQQWKTNFLTTSCGGGQWAVRSVDADHAFVGEGQGYGMTISALMADVDPQARTVFDGILRFVKNHPSVIDRDLHAAEQNPDCVSVNGSDSATDADLEIAYALLLADRRWGSGGAYNYRQEALRIIAAIKRSEVHSGNKLPLVADWASSGSHNNGSRSSDWMPGHFRAFAKATGDSFWHSVRGATENAVTRLQQQFAPNTGLLPDFVQDTQSALRPAIGKFLENEVTDGKYSWNACRDPWRLGVDAITVSGSAAQAQVRKMNAWIKQATGGDPNRIAKGYDLNGTVVESGSSAAFFAPFAVAAMADPGSQAWLDRLWAKLASTSLSSTDYYASSIQVQVLLVLAGRYVAA